MNSIDFIQDNDTFLEGTIKYLQKKLHRNPGDFQLKLKLGEALRMSGKKELALGNYEWYYRKFPENKIALWNYYIFSGKDLPKDLFFETPVISPFFEVENFLTEREQEKIWDIIENNREHFEASKTYNSEGEGEVNSSYRVSQVLYGNNFPEFTQTFLSKNHDLILKVISKLQFSFTEYEKEIGLQLTAHHGGNFFKTHSDSNPFLKEIKTRKITFVYYFHRNPKKFEGGNLLLFDSTQDGKSYISTKYTKIFPEHNKIIFFPSHCYHKVTPIRLISNDFRDGRFTINGWIHA